MEPQKATRRNPNTLQVRKLHSKKLYFNGNKLVKISRLPYNRKITNQSMTIIN